jgi:hypothetical protein
MMRAGLLLIAFAIAAGPAVAQTAVGEDTASGLHWHVAAPAGASWTLDCRFRPVTYAASAYEQARWANRTRLSGAGPQAGRLPGNDGRCTLTKTGGAGPVGLALVRGDEVTSAGAARTGETAYAGLL